MLRNFRIYAALAVMLPAVSASAQSITGITTDDRVFTMGSAIAPAFASGPITITGLASGMTVAGADYRPNTGELYILGYNSTTTAVRLYTLNAETGVATAIGTADLMLPLGSGSVGFDFNPTVDRIRVVSANGSNYRLHPVTGALAATDGVLNYVAGDANAGATPSIGAAAYTNSYIGSEATTLFDIDENLSILTRQNPPNAGGLETVGSLGFTFDAIDRSIDMDIYTDPETGVNTAYLAANPSGISFDNLYTINTTTGAATLVGTIGLGLQVKDIAVVIEREVPELAGDLMFGLTRINRNLVQFDAAEPGVIRSMKTVTGILAGQRLAALDVRPKTMQLYGLGFDDATQAYSLYTIDTATGAATAIGAPGIMNIAGGRIGFDFNPTVDRIRVVSSTDSNYRLNPDNGLIAAFDVALAYAAGDVAAGTNPNVGSVAYTNSYQFATATTLYGIDDTSGSFIGINPPNAGTLNTIAAGVFTGSMTDLTSDLDVFYDSTTMSNRIYLAANEAMGANDRLYMLTPAGVATDMGRIGTAIQIMDIAAALRYTGSLAAGISDAAVNSTVTLFPNPAANTLQVRMEQAKPATFTLVSTTGAMLYETSSANGTASIDVSRFPAGVYILHAIQDGGRKVTQKWVKL